MQNLTEFLNSYRARKYQKGEIILVQGEIPECAYIIKSGVVKTYNLTSQGEEKPLSFDVPGDVFPIGWVYGQIKWAQYYYEAFVDCELYCVPRQELVNFLRQRPELVYEQLLIMVKHAISFQMRLNALEQSKAINKVVNTLHYLCLSYGQPVKGGDLVRIDLPLTQQELANFMGLTRETTGIELKKLQKRGIISYRRQNYVVKVGRLNELLDEEYDMGQVTSG